jgi:TrwC relaxase
MRVARPLGFVRRPMIVVKPRRDRNLDYLLRDEARELAGLRDGGPLRWLRGRGNLDLDEDRRALMTTTPRARIVGYDMIVAAPRTVSILIALDEAQAGAVVTAHQRAVASTVDYLERRALVVRNRCGGEDRERGAHWAKVASFTHGVNRHGEPHLHDHVLVGARPANEDTVLDSRSLYAHLRAADSLYGASLRAEIANLTKYRPWRSFDGRDHVEGLDEGYRTLWGGHFADRGIKRLWRREEVREKWLHDERRFESLGVIEAPPRRRELLDEHRFAATLEGRLNIGRHHLVQAWADAATFGVSSLALERSLDMLYPTTRGSRGLRGAQLTLREARATSLVRERGERPLDVVELERWRQMSRERSRECEGRSR